MSSERIMNLLVTIPAESRRMNVGKDVIRILGSPAYICILQRKDGQIYAEKFTSACLICKVFYGKMKAQ